MEPAAAKPGDPQLTRSKSDEGSDVTAVKTDDVSPSPEVVASSSSTEPQSPTEPGSPTETSDAKPTQKKQNGNGKRRKGKNRK